MVKNPPAIRRPTFDPWVGKIPMPAHSGIHVWRAPWTEEPGGDSLWVHKELDTIEQLALEVSIGELNILYLYYNYHVKPIISSQENNLPYC